MDPEANSSLLCLLLASLMISLHYTEAYFRPTVYQVSFSQTTRLSLLATDFLSDKPAFMITLSNTPLTLASHSSRSQKENINGGEGGDNKDLAAHTRKQKQILKCFVVVIWGI